MLVPTASLPMGTLRTKSARTTSVSRFRLWRLTRAAAVAADNGIPFYVCAPLSTIDLKTATGDAIVIEVRLASVPAVL